MKMKAESGKPGQRLHPRHHKKTESFASEELAIHRHKTPNTTAVTTKNRLLVEKLLKLKRIKGKDEDSEVSTYDALASNQVRGVINLEVAEAETAETHRAHLRWKTTNIVTSGQVLICNHDNVQEKEGPQPRPVSGRDIQGNCLLFTSPVKLQLSRARSQRRRVPQRNSPMPRVRPRTRRRGGVRFALKMCKLLRSTSVGG